MNCREMLQLVDVLASEKNVAKDTVFGVLEDKERWQRSAEGADDGSRCLCQLISEHI